MSQQEPQNSLAAAGGEKASLLPALSSLLCPHTQQGRDCSAELLGTQSPHYKLLPRVSGIRSPPAMEVSKSRHMGVINYQTHTL